MRETNHLRKYANEAGKQMRGPRKSSKFRPANMDGWQQCAVCDYMKASHDPRNPQFEHYRNEGMCPEFREWGQEGTHK